MWLYWMISVWMTNIKCDYPCFKKFSPKQPEFLKRLIKMFDLLYKVVKINNYWRKRTNLMKNYTLVTVNTINEKGVNWSWAIENFIWYFLLPQCHMSELKAFLLEQEQHDHLFLLPLDFLFGHQRDKTWCGALVN